ncbi:hypothetical protein OHB01_35860 [Microbispora hainanensis]|uniref:hypothetical protein n=1 Tax=Microbispora TaxID=2005 RepID=UPI001167787A|nr:MULTISPECIES: hypothetical protein [Microbispora]NJP30251.1 hypothetical protein [Microbispora sp. CL1-1]TQS02240.1 hypothetical protein FLW53_39885 [Microbispora sp. SCL1-1]
MTYRFTARVAGGDEDFDENYRQAGIAENEDGSGFMLIFMSGIEEAGDQDADLGLDTHLPGHRRPANRLRLRSRSHYPR